MESHSTAHSMSKSEGTRNWGFGNWELGNWDLGIWEVYLYFRVLLRMII